MELTGAEIVCESLSGKEWMLYSACPEARCCLSTARSAAILSFGIFWCVTSRPLLWPPTAIARATGKVGVCAATSGPGATNLVTGIAGAQMDSIPMVAITGQVPRPAIGRDSFQETDITGITLPITKHNMLIMNVEDIALAIKEAFHIAPYRPARPSAFGHSEGRTDGGTQAVRLAGFRQLARLQPAGRSR